MKTKICLWSLLVVLMATIMNAGFASCSDNEDFDIEQREAEVTSKNRSKLYHSKWELLQEQDVDYNFGDSCVVTRDDTVIVYFYASDYTSGYTSDRRKGYIYYSIKDPQSASGASRIRAVAHFEYDVDVNDVKLDYITDQILPIQGFEFFKGRLQVGDSLKFYEKEMTVNDEDFIKTVQGEEYDHCAWYYDLKSTLWIKGDWIPSGYSSYATSLKQAIFKANKVIINEGVTSIEEYAFQNCTGLTSIDIPNSVTWIGDYAFYGCTGLTNIIIPNSVTTIGYYAFQGCTGTLTINCDIPNGDGYDCFLRGSEFTKVHVNSKSIGRHAFSDLSTIKTLELGDSVESIGDAAFQNCTGLTSIDIPNSVTWIGDYAFYGCTGLTSIAIPNSVTTIGDYAFCGCFKKIVIGSGLQEMGYNAFITDSIGELFVKCPTPPSTYGNIIKSIDGTSVESGWTLYVPEGCKYAYANVWPWSEFKSIVEDSRLGKYDAKTND